MSRTAELYLHIPFCERKCAYCDFPSFPASIATQRQYVDALLQEIRQTWCPLPISTIFLGGGTPSLLPAEWITEILETVYCCYSVCTDVEITIEANPGTIDLEKLQSVRAAGINRISLGVQSFRDEELRLLGRIHTAAEAKEGIAYARTAGFDNLNIDLIYALPGQTKAHWEDTLQQAIDLAPSHISAYSLMLEEETPLGKRYRDDGPATPPLLGEEEERLLMDDTVERLEEAGYRRYEISNYAREGAVCRHNIGYWTGVPYLGLGLAAASFLPENCLAESIDEEEEDILRSAMSREDNMAIWDPDAMEEESEPLPESRKVRWVRYNNTDSMLAYTAGVYAHTGLQILRQKDLESEFMMLGLRMTDGVEDEVFRERFGHRLDTVYGSILQKYEKSGWMRRENGRTALTKEGLAVSNHILVDFL